MRRRLFPYSLRRIVLWILYYGAIAAAVVSVALLTSHYLHERTSKLDGHVSLSLQKLKYEQDEEVLFSVVNNSDSKIVIDNNCPDEPLIVYRWENSKWVRIHKYISENDCPNQDRLITIKPHKSLTGSYKNWQDLFSSTGIYRIAVVVNGYSGLAFQDIEITEKTPTTPASSQPVLENNSVIIESQKTEDSDRLDKYEDNN